MASGSWAFKDCGIHVSAGSTGQLDLDLPILGFENGRPELATDMSERPLRFRRASTR